MHPLRLWAFILSGAWLALYVAGFAAGFQPLIPSPATRTFDLMVLAGGPLCLLLCTLAAVRWERGAASWLWFGSAVAAMGLGLRSGPHVGRYFGQMALIVLPQAVAATLFLLHARKVEKAAKAAKKG